MTISITGTCMEGLTSKRGGRLSNSTRSRRAPDDALNLAAARRVDQAPKADL